MRPPARVTAIGDAGEPGGQQGRRRGRGAGAAAGSGLVAQVRNTTAFAVDRSIACAAGATFARAQPILGRGLRSLGSHTAGHVLLRQARQLHLVLICDGCGSERAQLGRIDYAPSPRRLVGHLAELTGRELGLDEEQVARVRFAALVCDIGRDRSPRRSSTSRVR